MINERVQLSAKCRTEEGALLVDYELSNHGQEPIVAFDGAVGDPAKILAADGHQGLLTQTVKHFVGLWAWRSGA